MQSKIQGEGDYEAARRFNKNEQDFVKHKYTKKQAVDKKHDPYLPQDDVQDEDTVELRNPRIQLPNQK
jgi:hypothetical protein